MAYISIEHLYTPTRELVESLLKAQENRNTLSYMPQCGCKLPEQSSEDADDGKYDPELQPVLNHKWEVVK